MPLDKIENKTLRQKVYEEFSESIIAGEWFPGQIFSLRELAEKMGVSIMPVREALWQMESEKIIIIENNKRMCINILNKKELKELYKVRLFLEIKLAETAFDNKNSLLINQLDKIYTEMEKSLPDFDQYMKLNKQFHFTIYMAANCNIYLDIVKSLWLREAPYFNVQNKIQHLGIQLEPHKRMLQAFIKSEKSTLTNALKEDIDSFLEYILPNLE